MQITFDYDKTLQACAFLLKKAGGNLPRLTLLKLLYIADREFLFKKCRTITGDTMFAMKFGPVLSITYNLLRGKDSQSLQWREYILSLPDKEKTASLIKNPGTLDLSKSEVQTLEQVFEKYGRLPQFELSKLTHDFPEWQLFNKEYTSTKVDAVQILTINNRKDCIPVYQEQLSLIEEQRAIFI